MNPFRVPEAQAFRDIKQKVKLMSNGKINIKTYHGSIKKKKNGYESADNESNKIGRISSKIDKKEMKTIRQDSLIRTRNRIVDLALENEEVWTTFITLTFKENISNVEIANKMFNHFTKQIRRSFPNFMYLGVLEFQKRGAVHYHLLTNLKCGSNLCPLQEDKEKQYDVKYWNHGFSSVFDLTETDKSFNVGLYLVKYLYKDFSNRLWGRNKILKSNNLRNPTIFDLEENNEKYNYAKEYIESHGYEYTEKEIIPKNKYAIPFSSVDATISKDDISCLKNELGKEKRK